jgi:predicted DNA-binding protein (UPF0251 family)
MLQQRIADPISAQFGDDKPVVTYSHIADQIRSMTPKALPASQYDDVVVLIEWLRDEALRVHDYNEAASKALAAREIAVTKRERDVAIRQRTHDAATRTRGFLRYFGR